MSQFEAGKQEYDVGDCVVAAFNGAVACFANRRVFAENDRCMYVMRDGMAPKRGSDLFSELGFTARD